MLAMVAAMAVPATSRAQDTPTPSATPSTTPGSETMANPVTVTGAIVFPESMPAGPSATIHVRIEDVSLADAPATVVTSVTLENVAIPPPADQPVVFAIPVETYDPRMRYGVRVHVDRDGDGRVSGGDLVSTSHHPVLTHGGGAEVSIPVSEVAGSSAVTARSPIPPVIWELVGYIATGVAPVAVADPARYTLQFLPGGRLLARLDCNQGSGGYTAADGALALTPMATTLKRCLPGSHDADFGRLLHAATSYRFDPEGFLLLRGADGVLRLQPALTGVLWQWQGNVANVGTPTLTPDHPENYTVTFLPEGRLAIQADCNRATGAWTVVGAGINLAVGGVTRRACPPGSHMQPFLDGLDAAVSHGIYGGNLALALAKGNGLMVLAPIVADADRATPATG
jgi:putative lipoprotein